MVIEPFTPPLYDDYDIHPDGKTLALVRPVGEAEGELGHGRSVGGPPH